MAGTSIGNGFASRKRRFDNSIAVACADRINVGLGPALYLVSVLVVFVLSTAFFKASSITSLPTEQII